jgi:26S proteasome regulatory subunit N4
MGLLMDNLHAPTVTSGPVSSRSNTTNDQYDGKSLRDLIAEKDRVQEELLALGSVLESVSQARQSTCGVTILNLS